MATTLVLNENHPIRIEYGKFNLAEDQKIINKLIEYIKANNLQSISCGGKPITVEGDWHVYTSLHTKEEAQKIEQWLNKRGIYRQKVT